MEEATSSFQEQFRTRLAARGDQILLRIAVAPNFDNPLELSGPAILERSAVLCSGLCPTGQHNVVLLLLPHSPELFLFHLGLVAKGQIPAILSWPTSRIDPEKYQRNLLHQLQNLPADLLVTLPRLADNLRSSLPYPVVGCPIENSSAFENLFPISPVSQILESSSPCASNSRPSPDTLFLQFSGGTTGAQKAVVVTAPMLTAQLDLLAEALQVSTKDRVVSWLPMYHDMGLIACLWFALWHGLPSLHIGANDWIMNPELLFDYTSRFDGTLCWLPNFAFSYLAQRRLQMVGTHKLHQVRAWINCSEPVRRRSMLSFQQAFADWGVQLGSLQASYAMAESVFAVTQTTLQSAPAWVSRNTLRTNARHYTELAYDLVDDVFTSSGRALRATDIRIVDPNGLPCPDGAAGEILIQTPSLFSGYWGNEGFRTTSLTAGGWHATGDCGFLKDGELFVIGRIKDIIIIGGQNVFPEDVELVVNSVRGVYPGRVVAFGMEDENYGTQSLAIAAEMAAEYNSEDAAKLTTEIRKTVLATIGIAPRYVLAAPQRWIVKSTAGKISRRETRERFLREHVQPQKVEVLSNA